MDPSNFVGRAPEQVEDFMRDEIDPILIKYDHLLSEKSVDKVNV